MANEYVSVYLNSPFFFGILHLAKEQKMKKKTCNLWAICCVWHFFLVFLRKRGKVSKNQKRILEYSIKRKKNITFHGWLYLLLLVNFESSFWLFFKFSPLLLYFLPLQHITSHYQRKL